MSCSNVERQPGVLLAVKADCEDLKCARTGVVCRNGEGFACER